MHKIDRTNIAKELKLFQRKITWDFVVSFWIQLFSLIRRFIEKGEAETNDSAVRKQFLERFDQNPKTGHVTKKISFWDLFPVIFFDCFLILNLAVCIYKICICKGALISFASFPCNTEESNVSNLLCNSKIHNDVCIRQCIKRVTHY